MWARHRIDIGWLDLIAAAAGCCLPGRWDAHCARVARECSSKGDAFACLSVRSGLDLLLSTLNLEPGSEVLFSAITVPDMVRIAEHHGLMPVPLDLESSTLSPTADAIDRAVTSQSKAIVVAHLFGRRLNLDPLVTVAKRHGLFFIEDCAQAYAGEAYRGHDEADASLFSFGPIKTATALGGAMVRVSDCELLQNIRSRQSKYPLQSRFGFLRRIVKYAGLKFVSSRIVNGMLIRLLGDKYERWVAGTARGFAAEFEIDQYRRRPPVPMLRLLHRRLRRFSESLLKRRGELGRRLRERILPTVAWPGDAAGYHDHWVFPVLTDDPVSLAARLRSAGFDTARPNSLCAVTPPSDRPELRAVNAERLLDQIVFVPMYAALTNRALDRLADALLSS